MAEIWKDIPEYEGLYQASTLGRVRSVKNGRDVLIWGSKNKNGYYHVTLSKNDVTTCFSKHSLIAIVFLGHKRTKSPFIHVDHINKDKTNNSVSNLRVITCRQNTAINRKRKSKFVGVSYVKKTGKWQSRLESRGVRKYLGSFKCETKAHFAYLKALQEIGETVYP